MSTTVRQIQAQLRKLSSREKAAFLQRFFKTGPGEYAEGDIFIGLKVPETRKVARQHRDLPLEKTQLLLSSPIHEERLLALIILVHQFSKADAAGQKNIYDLYLDNTRHINNWDLVDCSAEHIPGPYLFNRSRRILYRLAKSKSLWERRIAIMATFHFIKNDDYADTLSLAERLLDDQEDLIHKATGWMLREIGKRNQDIEENFLEKHYQKMPRTMLRYAIERFPESRRQAYLKGKI